MAGDLQLDHGPTRNVKQENTAYRAGVRGDNKKVAQHTPGLIHAGVSGDGQKLVVKADAAASDTSSGEYKTQHSCNHKQWVCSLSHPLPQPGPGREEILRDATAVESSKPRAERSDVKSLRDPEGVIEHRRRGVEIRMAEQPDSAVRSSGRDMHSAVGVE